MKTIKEMLSAPMMLLFIFTVIGLVLFTSIAETNKKDLCIRQDHINQIMK